MNSGNKVDVTALRLFLSRLFWEPFLYPHLCCLVLMGEILLIPALWGSDAQSPSEGEDQTRFKSGPTETTCYLCLFALKT